VCDYINVASDAATSILRRLHSHVGAAGRGAFTPLAAPVGRESVRPARGAEDATTTTIDDVLSSPSPRRREYDLRQAAKTAWGVWKVIG
jgi:hypothetical protein